MGLMQLAVNLRGKLVRQFEMQARILPEELLVGHPRGITHEILKGYYGQYDDSEMIATRVLNKWDKNKDGVISALELRKARSRTDSKISLGALDPGTGGSWFDMGWGLFGIIIQVYYVLSIVNELAKAKQLELDEIDMARLTHRQKDENKKLQ